MLRFRLATILFFLTALSLGFGWYVDHTNLRRELVKQQHPIDTFWEKHSYWSPSLHLGSATDELEFKIADRIGGFSGRVVESSQGFSDRELRQPSTDTIDKVVPLLDDADSPTRLAAARLLALYLEAVSGLSNTDHESLATRAYLQVNVQGKVPGLLEDEDPDIRAAGALILGNFYYSGPLEEVMMEAFDRETDGTVKIYLAWAHHSITDELLR